MFSQTTIQDAATNPAVHQALLQKIERDKQEVKVYRVGHVIVGRVLLEGADDPEFIRSQMMIFEDGFFSDAVKDLNRPIAFRKLGYHPVDAAIPVGASPDDSGAIDIGTIPLEQPVQISIEYIVALGSAVTFDPKAKETAVISGGVKWKSRRTTEWDLEFVQSGSTLQFNYSYAPCTLADLGEGALDDFIRADIRQAKLDPRRVRFASGHVYLLNHQQSLLNHAVLFRVQVQKP